MQHRSDIARELKRAFRVARYKKGRFKDARDKRGVYCILLHFIAFIAFYRILS
jgi:hypothetical protein